MRKITGLYFDGAGKYETRTCMKLLHERLDDGLSALSGLQQGYDGEDAKQEIEDVCADIVAALLGIDFISAEVLPYPGEWKL